MIRKDVLFYKDDTGKMVGIAIDRDFNKLTDEFRKTVINECKEYAIDILSRRKWARNLLKENEFHDFPLEVLNNMFPLLPGEIQKFEGIKEDLSGDVVFYERRKVELDEENDGVSVYDDAGGKNIYFLNKKRIVQ